MERIFTDILKTVQPDLQFFALINKISRGQDIENTKHGTEGVLHQYIGKHRMDTNNSRIILAREDRIDE